MYIHTGSFSMYIRNVCMYVCAHMCVRACVRVWLDACGEWPAG